MKHKINTEICKFWRIYAILDTKNDKMVNLGFEKNSKNSKLATKNYPGVDQGFPFPYTFTGCSYYGQVQLADIPFVADFAGILEFSRRHTFRTFRSSQTYLS